MKTLTLTVGGFGDFVASKLSLDNVVSINSDRASLTSLSNSTLLLGDGLGAGGDPENGYNLASNHADEINSLIDSIDIVYIVAGFGKGTGSGCSLYLSELLKDKGIYSILIARLPESLDGEARRVIAENSLDAVIANVNAYAVVDNDTLIALADPTDTIDAVYTRGNKAVMDTINTLDSVVTYSGIRNVDLADFRATIQGRFTAGLETSIYGLDSQQARRALSVVEYNPGQPATLSEIMKAKTLLKQSTNSDIDIINGILANPTISTTRHSVILSGYEKTLSEKRREAGLKGLERRYNLANPSKSV
jgi:cell division protein FtsZ